MTDLGARADGRVAVVGAGVVGAFTALALRRAGESVILVDPGIREDRCSFGNAGSLSPGSVAPLGMPGVLKQVPGWLLDGSAPLHVRPGYWLRALPWLLRFVASSRPARVEEISHGLKALVASSIDLYATRLKELGASDLLRRTGQLQVYPDAAKLAKDRAVWQLRRDRGVTVEEVSADDIRQLEPAVGPHYQTGVFLPNEGMVVDPARLVDTLAEAFVRNGGEILNARVSRLGIVDGTVRVLVTDRGEVAVDRVVIAAGAWSNELSRQLGDDLPLQTQRGYHVSLQDPGIELRRPVVAADRKYFATPMETGLRIAGTVEFAALDAAPDERRVDNLIRLAPELLPGLQSGKSTRWMGHRPCLPDSLPVIDGARSVPNVFYAFGNGHLGLTGAPMTADIVTALVLNRPPPVDPAPYRASRFG